MIYKVLKSISVVIPVLNEEAHLDNCINSLGSEADQIIVVDGGSRDASREIAYNRNCVILETSKSRALQMNFGAAHAKGDILLFVHADTQLPNGWSMQIRRSLSNPKNSGCAFRFSIDQNTTQAKIIEFLTNIRAIFLHLPYGDQGIAIRTQDFYILDGFKEIPIMEDFDFVQRLGQIGTIDIIQAQAITSGRRWLKNGFIKTTLINQIMIAGYYFGYSPEDLAKFYEQYK